MEEKYTCYCGLYCENCAVKARVEPTAKALYKEMKHAGFEEIIDMMPNGSEFWAFLKGMGESGTCLSCRDGSGNPGCAIRICAREKEVNMCAICKQYPCDHFDELFACYPGLDEDNAVWRNLGMEAWAKMQNERRAVDFTYPDMREKETE